MNDAMARDTRPIGELNTTPLIDIMLVLLIMFIVTIPLQTHAVKLDLPSGPTVPLPVQPTRNLVEVTDAGAVLWNGVAVDDATLRRQLRASQQLHPLPELHVRPTAGARYERVDQLLATLKREQVARVGFVGNEAYAGF